MTQHGEPVVVTIDMGRLAVGAKLEGTDWQPSVVQRAIDVYNQIPVTYRPAFFTGILVTGTGSFGQDVARYASTGMIDIQVSRFVDDDDDDAFDLGDPHPGLVPDDWVAEMERTFARVDLPPLFEDEDLD